MPGVSIRAEQPDDAAPIAQVLRRAYAGVSYSDHREHIMVERLREQIGYIPALSLLAEVDEKAVGHILLTPAYISDRSSGVETLALAPLSVVPDFQSLGVGKQLVRAAHRQAAQLGFGSVVLVGIASYYAQFGYESLSRYPITLPFDAPATDCMMLALIPNALDGVAGMVRYLDGWLDH